MDIPSTKTTDSTAANVPAIDARQMLALTDDTGIFQHARLALPDPNHGYCVDDNARALIAAVRLRPDELRGGQTAIDALIGRYLTFVTYAIDPDTRRVRNFMSYDRRWLEPVGSHDSQGRALWGLGVTAAEAPHGYQRELAGKALGEALPGTEPLDSIRTWAFLVIALDAWLECEDAQRGTEARKRYEKHAGQLAEGHRSFASSDWLWWEPVVTYDNGRLPQAMLLAGQRLGRADYTDIGLASLAWLLEIQTDPDTGYLRVIGNDGWYTQTASAAGPARFDQQPLEPAALIDACAAAHRATGDVAWLAQAQRCLAWYHGDNDLRTPLIHPETGGCQDGLTATAVNRNQGAESVLSYIMSCQAHQRMQLHK